MPNYRRAWVPGGTYFFTVNLLERERGLLVEHGDALRSAFRAVREAHPFDIVAMVVLPDHLHCIWTLPDGDADNAGRWRSIKAGFSRTMPVMERRSASRHAQRERGIWQRRFWERLTVDERDLQAHVNDVHLNPVKHGWVAKVADWPYSSFHRYVREGRLSPDWAGDG